MDNARIDAVLSAISTGAPVMRACESFGVPRRDFYRLLDDPKIAERYARAIAQQARSRFGAAINCTEGEPT